MSWLPNHKKSEKKATSGNMVTKASIFLSGYFGIQPFLCFYYNFFLFGFVWFSIHSSKVIYILESQVVTASQRLSQNGSWRLP